MLCASYIRGGCDATYVAARSRDRRETLLEVARARGDPHDNNTYHFLHGWVGTEGQNEILRIARPGRRLTFCGDAARYGRTKLLLGSPVERLTFPNPATGGTTNAWVRLMR